MTNKEIETQTMNWKCTVDKTTNIHNPLSQIVRFIVCLYVTIRKTCANRQVHAPTCSNRETHTDTHIKIVC